MEIEHGRRLAPPGGMHSPFSDMALGRPRTSDLRRVGAGEPHAARGPYHGQTRATRVIYLIGAIKC